MGNDVKWIKITTNMFDDEKIRIIEKMPDGDSILVIWIKLLTLAGRINSSGYIMLTENIPYTDETLAVIFDRPLMTVQLALQTFQRFEMLHYQDGKAIISNWDKHQNIDGLDKIREQTRLRVNRFRLKPGNVNCNVTVTHCNETEQEQEQEQERDNIYTLWNKQDIVIHQKLTRDIKTAIMSVLKDYSESDIIQAIKNYAEILKRFS